MSEVVVIDGQEYPEPPPGIRVNSNGSGRDAQGKFTHPPGTFGPNPHAITSENAADMARRGHELTKQRINRAIVERTLKRDGRIFDGPHAVGYAAGALWDDIVLNDDAPPRDRRQTWLDISRAAGLLQDPRSADSPPPGGAQINISADAIAAILQATGRGGGGE